MPFTVSHIAAVVPFRQRPGRAGLPLAALAAGSMSPDLPYFVPVLVALGADGGLTHSVLGVVTVDVVFGLAMWAAWYGLAPAVRDMMPSPVRDRWPPAAPRRAGLVVLCAAVVLGAATHVLWDAFTHVGRFGHTHVPALAVTYPSPLGPLPGYRYLQYLSGVIGLVVLALLAVRQPRSASEPRVDPGAARAFPWWVGAGLVVALTVRAPALLVAPEPRTFAFLAITAAGSGVLGAAVAAGGLWHLRHRHERVR